tara:strand:- start:3 stop:182 length:180 start_codon:yes stop_codon:yes gene_type:complete
MRIEEQNKCPKVITATGAMLNVGPLLTSITKYRVINTVKRLEERYNEPYMEMKVCFVSL